MNPQPLNPSTPKPLATGSRAIQSGLCFIEALQCASVSVEFYLHPPPSIPPPPPYLFRPSRSIPWPPGTFVWRGLRGWMSSKRRLPSPRTRIAEALNYPKSLNPKKSTLNPIFQPQTRTWSLARSRTLALSMWPSRTLMLREGRVRPDARARRGFRAHRSLHS